MDAKGKTFKDLLFIIFGGITLLLTSSCSTLVNVRANTYKLEPIKEHQVFCIIKDLNQDPALEEELSRKLKKLLQNKGFTVIDNCQFADYAIAFQFSMSSRQTIDTFYLPQQYYETENGYFSGSGNNYYYGNTNFSGSYTSIKQKTVYLPITITGTDYIRKLTLFVIDANSSRKARKIKIAWEGNFISVGSSSDFRTIANYILVAINKLFGKDTKGTVTLIIDSGSKEYKNLMKILEEQ